MDKEIKQQFQKLTNLFQNGFIDSEKKTDKKIENLAIMVKKGFDGVDARFDGVDTRFDGVDERFNKVEFRLRTLEKGQELILAKLDKMVFKEDFDLLVKRVKILEQAIGIR